MDIDSSENRNLVSGAKPDSHSNGGNNVTSKIPSVNDDKTDLIVGNCEQHKVDNVGDEDQKPPSISDGTISYHQVPKSEFPFRETSSYTITDSNNQMSDLSTATEFNTSVAPEIKQDGSCSPTDDPLPPYAVSKIQVSCRCNIII